MSDQAWDPENPPADPPPGADPLLWRLAFGLRRDHHPHTDGFCVTCRLYWPCPSRRLAEHGLSAAVSSSDRRHRDGPGNAGHRY